MSSTASAGRTPRSPGSPGSPRIRKSAEQRASEIERAAVSLAREQGLSALTLRAVAERAGVASSLIAHYRPSMDDLVAEVYTALVSAELGEVRAMLSETDAAAPRFAALLATLMDGAREDLTVVWVEGWAMARRNEALAGAVRVQMGQWHRLVAALVTDGIAEGAFAVDDAGAVAWQLLGMIDGLNAQSLARDADPAVALTQMTRAAETLLGARPGAIRQP